MDTNSHGTDRRVEECVYDESQGIIDIAVKLYVMAQIKVIADGTEIITVKDIKEVAAEEFWVMQEMFEALRTGDFKKLAQYEDIRPIKVADYLAAQLAHIAIPLPDFSKDGALSLEEEAALTLIKMDISSKVAYSSVRKVIGNSTVGQPLSRVVKKAFKLALNMETEPAQQVRVEQDGDLRNNADGNLHDKLKNNGSIAETADEF